MNHHETNQATSRTTLSTVQPYAFKYTKVTSLRMPYNQIVPLDIVLDCMPYSPAFCKFTCCEDPNCTYGWASPWKTGLFTHTHTTWTAERPRFFGVAGHSVALQLGVEYRNHTTPFSDGAYSNDVQNFLTAKMQRFFCPWPSQNFVVMIEAISANNGSLRRAGHPSQTLQYLFRWLGGMIPPKPAYFSCTIAPAAAAYVHAPRGHNDCANCFCVGLRKEARMHAA